MKTKKRIDTGHLILGIGVICLVIAGIVGFRYFRQLRHRPFPRPTETNVELIQGWMTLPYVSRTYHVPLPYLYETISVDNENLQKTNLDTIAKQKGMSPAEMISLVKDGITKWQQTKP